MKNDLLIVLASADSPQYASAKHDAHEIARSRSGAVLEIPAFCSSPAEMAERIIEFCRPPFLDWLRSYQNRTLYVCGLHTDSAVSDALDHLEHTIDVTVYRY